MTIGRLLLHLVTCLVFTYATGCIFPPRAWCGNESIARQCKVYEQCKRYVWANTGRAGDELHFESEEVVNAEIAKQFYTSPEVNPAPKVRIGVYYEFYCGMCRQFIADMLHPTFLKLGSIMNITMVPYGNEIEYMKNGTWHFMCQHGPDECVGNMIETCSIDIVKDISVYMPFFICAEAKYKEKPRVAARECAEASKVQIPIDEILQCVDSPRGVALEHKMAVLTDNLRPKHQYAPWITVNGFHNETVQMDAFKHLPRVVCDLYQGPKPAACTSNV